MLKKSIIFFIIIMSFVIISACGDSEDSSDSSDKITVGGKEYTATFLGKEDINWHEDYTSREFWRLENAYDDFKNAEKTGIVKPCDNYPMLIETEQVFVLDFTKNDDSVNRLYYIFDGSDWQNTPVTSQIKIA